MNFRIFSAFILLIFVIPFSQAQSSNVKQLVIEEFKQELGDLALQNMWKTNFGFDYDETYAVFEINAS